MVTRLKMPRNKYHARATTVDSERFDSHAEYLHYVALRQMEQDGEISCLLRQRKYILQPAFTDNWGRKWRMISYTADFAYIQADGQVVAEDVKGYPSRDFSLRAKLFQRLYPDIKLVIVRA